jgi:hypothetical protein
MQFDQLKRREFITILGSGAVAWPLAARAQQPAMPVIGLIDQRSPEALAANRLRGFRQGLRDAGFVDGQNVAIEYRWAENKNLVCHRSLLLARNSDRLRANGLRLQNLYTVQQLAGT